MSICCSKNYNGQKCDCEIFKRSQKPGDILITKMPFGYKLEYKTADKTYVWKIKNKIQLKLLLGRLREKFGPFEIGDIPQ